MKKLTLLLCITIFIGCAPQQKNTPNQKTEIILELPQKEIPDSSLMSESPINPINLDQYLFREDCIYLDLREPHTFYSEGSVAGFINLPFYDYIAHVNHEKNALYQMVKKNNEPAYKPPGYK